MISNKIVLHKSIIKKHVQPNYKDKTYNYYTYKSL